MLVHSVLLLLGGALACLKILAGFYLISDYYMDSGFPPAFGRACDRKIQDDCAFINSHLNSFGLADYDDHNDCRMILDAGTQTGARYKLKWERFQLEDSTNCTKDYLQLYQYIDETLVANGTSERFCGHEDPVINITRQNVVLRFFTDADDEDRGFRILATRTLPAAPCTNDGFHCKAENRCIDGRLHCDGTPQCDDESDEQVCSFWEKLIGGFLALGVAGIVGVASLCVLGCTSIGVTICVCTCCRERCGCLFKGCQNLQGTVCKGREKMRKVEPEDGTVVQNISEQSDTKEKERALQKEGEEKYQGQIINNNDDNNRTKIDK